MRNTLTGRTQRAGRLQLGMVSTYPPTKCGLATFSAALRRALVAQGHRVDMVQVADGDFMGAGPEVVAVLEPRSATSARRAARKLDSSDVVILQHEFGIFGPNDGDAVVDLTTQFAAPIVVVLHSVPAQPSARQASIIGALCDLASGVVVMSACARSRLRHIAAVPDSLVTVIPHGAQVAPPTAPSRVDHPPRLLSWGLLGPGKGIEHVIDAVALLSRRGRQVSYVVAGETHPKVFANSGNAYRDHLIERATDAGVGHCVSFDNTYRSVAEMTQLIASSTVVVTAYDTTDQVTSGVLVDSLAAGTPVVATAFPHAVELLSQGGGVLVPHGDPSALANAIDDATSDAGVLARLRIAARRLGAQMDWHVVATQYADLCVGLAPPESAVTA